MIKNEIKIVVYNNLIYVHKISILLDYLILKIEPTAQLPVYMKFTFLNVTNPEQIKVIIF